MSTENGERRTEVPPPSLPPPKQSAGDGQGTQPLATSGTIFHKAEPELLNLTDSNCGGVDSHIKEVFTTSSTTASATSIEIPSSGVCRRHGSSHFHAQASHSYELPRHCGEAVSIDLIIDLSPCIQGPSPPHHPPPNTGFPSMVRPGCRLQHPLRDSCSLESTPNTPHPQLPGSE